MFLSETFVKVHPMSSEGYTLNTYREFVDDVELPTELVLDQSKEQTKLGTIFVLLIG